MTGGAGFIGSWLCDALIILGARVTCIDNLVSGSAGNVSHLRRLKSFRLVKGDVTKWVPGVGYDLIIHGAAIPNPEHYERRPIDTMLPNSAGLHILLDHASRHDSTLLYMSTSEIYGDASVLPTPESYAGSSDPMSPRACYFESKRYGEAACSAYHRQYGLDVRIVRLFNTYGPRMDIASRYARVIPRFIAQSLRRRPITVHGDGSQTRSFCYVSDALAGILEVLRNSRARGEVFNIGNPREISILELARLVKKVSGSRSEIVYREGRLDDPSRRCPLISKARRLLRWQPEVPLEEGIERTVSWVAQRMAD